MDFKHKNLAIILLVCFFLQCVLSVKLQQGSLLVRVSEEHKENVEYSLKINSKISSILELTQSSRIKIEGKFKFSESNFRPQFVSFRLRHQVYQNLTEPVLAKYDSQNQQYHAEIDLGDPKQIKPYSDKYQLQIIVADESLSQNIRSIIADCNVKFRKSWDHVPSSDLHYKTQNIIETSAPAQRIDPPATFTLFIVILILALDGAFVFGLNHLKVNLSLFPKTSLGFLMNAIFLFVLMANLTFLLKFWINWTFLDTLQWLCIFILPTALVANYAFVHIKKD